MVPQNRAGAEEPPNAGYPRPWSLTYFGDMRTPAQRAQWFVPVPEWWAEYEAPRGLHFPLPGVLTYLAGALVCRHFGAEAFLRTHLVAAVGAR